MADDCGGESPFLNPQASGGSRVGLHLYVEDVDTVFDRAISVGGTVIKPVQDQFYGDRTGALKDPFGAAHAPGPTCEIRQVTGAVRARRGDGTETP